MLLMGTATPHPTSFKEMGFIARYMTFIVPVSMSFEYSLSYNWLYIRSFAQALPVPLFRRAT